MRKILITVSIFLVIILIPLALLLKNADNLINKYSYKALKLIESKQIISGIKINNTKFSTAHLETLNTITWSNISSQITINNKNDLGIRENFQINIEKIKINLKNFVTRKFILQAKHLNIKNTPNKEFFDKESQVINLTNGNLEISFFLDFFQPNKALDQIRELHKNLKVLLDGEKTPVPINFSGIMTFTINDELVKTKVNTQVSKQGYSLVLNKEFFKITSWLMEEELTDPEAVLLSKNPFRVPKLLKIKNSAQRESESRFKQDKWLQDAYRHVLWSYLLTKEYGSDFSKEITDAHELGVTDNTKQEQQMDYNNNNVGRQYALQEYKKSDIFLKFLNDSEVIRRP